MKKWLVASVSASLIACGGNGSSSGGSTNNNGAVGNWNQSELIAANERIWSRGTGYYPNLTVHGAISYLVTESGINTDYLACNVDGGYDRKKVANAEWTSNETFLDSNYYFGKDQWAIEGDELHFMKLTAGAGNVDLPNQIWPEVETLPYPCESVAAIEIVSVQPDILTLTDGVFDNEGIVTVGYRYRNTDPAARCEGDFCNADINFLDRTGVIIEGFLEMVLIPGKVRDGSINISLQILGEPIPELRPWVRDASIAYDDWEIPVIGE